MVTKVASEYIDGDARSAVDDMAHGDVDEEDEAPSPIIIDVFEGKVPDDTDASKRLFKLEGCVRVYDGPPLETLEEVAKLLEIISEKYAAPTLSSDCTTAFISLSSPDEPIPFARIEVRVDNA